MSFKNIEVNKNYFMSRTSFIKPTYKKSNSVDWERRKANSFFKDIRTDEIKYFLL